ncbi:MAG: hypothetical protein GX033_09020 [Firmicutes bacterium]|nr:hypothetical protein [Bacillota bacterium]
MDWPKAKNVLIIAFLLLDLYLAYLLFYVPGVGAMQTTLTDEDLEALIVLGKHFNVDLATRPQPMSVRPLPLLDIDKVSLDKTLATNLATRWLGAEAQGATQEDGLLFTAGTKKISFSQDNPYFFTLEYADTTPPPSQEDYSIQEAMADAQNFLTEHLGGAVLQDYKVNMAVATPASAGSYVIEISRSNKGIPIFLDSYRLVVNNGLVTAFTAKQAAIGEAQRTSLPLVSAEQVVRRYLARLGVPQEEEITILDLSLGYGVGVETGERQEIEPVWRFYLAGAEESEIFIPAAQVYWERPGN